MRLDQITNDDAETLVCSGSSSNLNCALRTLSRMLHKAEEWRQISRAPKLKLAKEYERELRLDSESEKKLLLAAAVCGWGDRKLTENEPFQLRMFNAAAVGMAFRRMSHHKAHEV